MLRPLLRSLRFFGTLGHTINCSEKDRTMALSGSDIEKGERVGCKNFVMFRDV